MPAGPAPAAAGTAGEPRLTVAAVARRLGIAPATLRTWDRRYGLGPSEHRAGAHRRYTPGDLVRLERMRRLVLEGVAPGEAARVVLATPRVGADPAAEGTGAEPGGLPRGPGGAPAAARRRGGPGGQVLALPGAEGVVRGVGRAATALDGGAVTDLVAGALADHGVVATWEQVLRPVLVAVGARWAATGQGVEVEHLLSDCIAVALRSHALQQRAVRPPVAGRPVLLAGAPGEQHALPLHVLAAALAERRLATRTLGPATPAEALHAAVVRTGPALLFVWSQLPGTADPAVVDGLPVTRPPTSLVVGGPGWAGDRLPPRVRLAADLPDALALADAATGA